MRLRGCLGGRRFFAVTRRLRTVCLPFWSWLWRPRCCCRGVLVTGGHQWPLAGGMALHIALDYANTYGAAVLWPMLRRRYSRQWMFFIDLPVTALTVAAVMAGIWWPLAAWVYGCLLVTYVIVRARLLRRAWWLCPQGTSHLIPSAIVPWQYLGLIEHVCSARMYQLNALTGQVWGQSDVDILDGKWLAALTRVVEFRIMRELSPAYHVTNERRDGEVTEITCRDLRTRNFGGRFGELQIAFARDGSIYRRTFHV